MELKDRIEAFVKHADEVTSEYWKRQGFTFSGPPTHRADYLSAKWCRILTVENGVGRSAFVCLQDGFTKALGTLKAGDIHKAATFKAPAKHARGSVFQEGFNNCATPHGIVYL